MTDGGKKFLWGVAIGLAAAALIKTDTFRKCLMLWKNHRNRRVCFLTLHA